MLAPQIPADPLINHGPHRSPFAANFQYTAARNGGRGHALRPPEQRAGAQLGSLRRTPARTSASRSASRRFNCDRSKPSWTS